MLTLLKEAPTCARYPSSAATAAASAVTDMNWGMASRWSATILASVEERMALLLVLSTKVVLSKGKIVFPLHDVTLPSALKDTPRMPAPWEYSHAVTTHASATMVG